jgi:hypothetical protein
MIIFIQTLLIIITFGQFSLYNITYVDRTIDTPIAELNNHTLREVFEGGNLVVDPYFEDDTKWFKSSTGFLTGNQLFMDRTGLSLIYPNIAVNPLQNTINGNIYYARYERKQNPNSTVGLSSSYIQLGATQYQSSNEVYSIKGTPDFSSNKNIYINNFIASDNILSFTLKSYHVIDMTSLGISALTVEQMDSYFNEYQELKEVSEHSYTYTINEVTLTDFMVVLSSAVIWFFIIKFLKEVF